METKFTKGQWVDVKYSPGNIVSAESGRLIANCMSYSSNRNAQQIYEENLANSRLIKAAPDMFEALLDIIQQLELAKTPVPADLADSIRVFGKAAIKKAIE